MIVCCDIGENCRSDSPCRALSTFQNRNIFILVILARNGIDECRPFPVPVPNSDREDTGSERYPAGLLHAHDQSTRIAFGRGALVASSISLSKTS